MSKCSGCQDRPLHLRCSACLVNPAPDLYASLRRVLALAAAQAESGKGKDRHATEGEAFEEQQIVQLGKWMGSSHYEIGQACKKSLESTRLPRDKALAELLGAIVYLAAAYLVREGEDVKRDDTGAFLDVVRAQHPGATDAAVRLQARLEALRIAEALR